MHISNSSIKKQVSCFKKIIRTNNIEDSIDIICETENDSTKKKLGKKKAFEIDRNSLISFSKYADH